MTRKRKLTAWEKVWYFYSAPMVKFQYYVVRQLVTLTLLNIGFILYSGFMMGFMKSNFSSHMIISVRNISDHSQVSYLVFLGIFIYTLIFARPNSNNADTGDWMSGSRYSGFEVYLLLYVLSTIPIEIIQVNRLSC